MSEQQDGELGMSGPGVSTVQIDELDAAIEKYNPIKQKRVELTAKEVEAKDKVIALLHAHKAEIGVDGDGVMHYRCGDYTVTLAPTKEKLTVKADDEDAD